MAEFFEGLLGAPWHRAEGSAPGVAPAKIGTNALAPLAAEAGFAEFLKSGHEVASIFLSEGLLALAAALGPGPLAAQCCAH